MRAGPVRVCALPIISHDLLSPHMLGRLPACARAESREAGRLPSKRYAL